VKKKYVVPSKEKKDWAAFTKEFRDIKPKNADLSQRNIEINRVRKLDLHGVSLAESNKIVKKFIEESYDGGYKKLLIITGKGLRSTSYKNPYISEQLSVLRYSVPEFIKNDETLNNKIRSISAADIKDGGEGAIYIFLNSNKKLQNKF
tara:strand:+ start:86 stop:529 length:444 start_codon:yes stop_codon:yes gene_type:complete